MGGSQDNAGRNEDAYLVGTGAGFTKYFTIERKG